METGRYKYYEDFILSTNNLNKLFVSDMLLHFGNELPADNYNNNKIIAEPKYKTYSSPP